MSSYKPWYPFVNCSRIIIHRKSRAHSNFSFLVLKIWVYQLFGGKFKICWVFWKYSFPFLQFYHRLFLHLGQEEEENSDGLGFVEQGWLRPDSETDKLYMSMGGGDIIEVGHPTPCDGKVDPRWEQDNIIIRWSWLPYFFIKQVLKW